MIKLTVFIAIAHEGHSQFGGFFFVVVVELFGGISHLLFEKEKYFLFSDYLIYFV